MWIKGTTTIETNIFVQDEFLESLQLTNEEYQILFIQPVTSIFAEAARRGEWKLVLDRELQNAEIWKYQKAKEDFWNQKDKEMGLVYREATLSGGQKVYMPIYE